MPSIKSLQEDLTKLQQTLTELTLDLQKCNSGVEAHTYKIGELKADIDSIQNKIDKIIETINNIRQSLEKRMDEGFVNNDRFEPIKLLTYGAAGILLLAILWEIILRVAPNLTNIPF